MMVMEFKKCTAHDSSFAWYQSSSQYQLGCLENRPTKQISDTNFLLTGNRPTKRITGTNFILLKAVLKK